MDILYIRDLRVEAVIGVHEWERRIRRKLRIDLEVGADAARAAASDRIEDTADYAAIAARVAAVAAEREYILLETLAERLSGVLLGEFGAPWCRVTVGKPAAVPGAAEAGVVVEREKP